MHKDSGEYLCNLHIGKLHKKFLYMVIFGNSRRAEEEELCTARPRLDSSKRYKLFLSTASCLVCALLVRGVYRRVYLYHWEHIKGSLYILRGSISGENYFDIDNLFCLPKTITKPIFNFKLREYSFSLSYRPSAHRTKLTFSFKSILLLCIRIFLFIYFANGLTHTWPFLSWYTTNLCLRFSLSRA